MKAERWPSMDRYADSLSQKFKESNLEFRNFHTEPPLDVSRVREFWRARVYPNFGRFFQGRVNHILDHSYSHLLNYLRPERTVVTCHDLIPLDFEDDGALLAGFKETVDNLHKAVRIITVSESTKTDLINKLGIGADKIDIVYSGVDPIFRPVESGEDKKKWKRKFGLPEGKIILNFGSNLRYKNVETLLMAFKEMIALYPSLYLLRIHPLSPEQKKLARDLGILSNYFEVLSPNDEDLVGLYNCGDIFLSPSLKEGFGLHVLEAMACGLPLVISKGTSLEEITGEYGIRVDPLDAGQIAEATLKAINKTGVPSQEGMVDRARSFSWQETARKTLAVYQKLVV